MSLSFFGRGYILRGGELSSPKFWGGEGSDKFRFFGGGVAGLCKRGEFNILGLGWYTGEHYVITALCNGPFTWNSLMASSKPLSWRLHSTTEFMVSAVDNWYYLETYLVLFCVEKLSDLKQITYGFSSCKGWWATEEINAKSCFITSERCKYSLNIQIPISSKLHSAKSCCLPAFEI